MIKKEMIAMLLAGGQGSRLGILTDSVAKPAVEFGGKYRIIDFPLSNCINSGIDTVGVLTQYQPLVLNAHIGNGQAWDLDRLHGGVSILQPYVRGKAGEWYKGTANAIYQNIHYIDHYNPSYVLILSGDHIYKMNYSKMLRQHKERESDCTIAVLDVPLEEASRFGIMNTRADGTIYEFEEKPKHPKSTKASMGIYIFTWEVLRRLLIEDEQDPASANDFGANIIPNMLEQGLNLTAYDFSSYWKDVGTIDSLWQANMDLLDSRQTLNLQDKTWRIYTQNPMLPPHFMASGAKVTNSLMTEGAYIDGTVNHSVLFHSVVVRKGATIRESIIMPGVRIEEGACVEYAIVAENAVISKGAKVGCAASNRPDHLQIAVVGAGIHIGENAVLKPGKVADKNLPAVGKEGAE
jgi:glucose-1-phosphate adenylyltransferase